MEVKEGRLIISRKELIKYRDTFQQAADDAVLDDALRYYFIGKTDAINELINIFYIK